MRLKKGNGICEVKSCRQVSDLVFYGKEVCAKHWDMHCNDSKRFNLKEHFNVKEAPSALPPVEVNIKKTITFKVKGI